MKKFLVKTSIFLLAIVTISLLVDITISYFLKQSHRFPGEFEVMNDIYDRKANCDIAVYGSSRAWVHIDPKIIEDSLNLSVYNFGIDGHSFWLQYLRHLELLKNNSKPKMILMSMDVFTLHKRQDLYGLEQFLPYMLWNKNIRDYSSSYTGFNKADYLVPLIRYSGEHSTLKTSFKNIFSSSQQAKYRQNGYRGMDKDWNSDLAKAREKKKKYEVILDSKTVDLFEIFIEECQKAEIELVFVYTPEFIEGWSYVSNRNEIINIYKDYAKKHQLIFLDYSDDEMCKDRSLFYNSLHLNKKGAEVFSSKLATDLKTQTQIINSETSN